MRSILYIIAVILVIGWLLGFELKTSWVFIYFSKLYVPDDRKTFRPPP
jgi:hypothetical protein